MTDKEQHVSTLVFPNEYDRNLNSLVGLTSQNVIYLKRVFLSKGGGELVKYPLSDCESVAIYCNELPPSTRDAAACAAR